MVIFKTLEEYYASAYFKKQCYGQNHYSAEFSRRWGNLHIYGDTLTKTYEIHRLSEDKHHLRTEAVLVGADEYDINAFLKKICPECKEPPIKLPKCTTIMLNPRYPSATSFLKLLLEKHNVPFENLKIDPTPVFNGTTGEGIAAQGATDEGSTDIESGKSNAT